MLIASQFLSQATVRFAVFGMATGSLYGLVALGVTLVHRSSGALHFGASALGAVSAFTFYSLRDDHGWNWMLALCVALTGGAAIGALTFVLLMRVLRASPPLTKLIATLALFVGSTALIAIVWPHKAGQVESMLPTDLVRFTSQIVLTRERLIIIVFTIGVAAALWWIFQRTTFGLATNAVAESPRVASASGWSPDLIQLVNFTLAGLLSALAAILIAPIVSLSSGNIALMAIGALASALVGRFSSFALIVGAAMTIGIVQAELAFFQPDIARLLGTEPTSLAGLAANVPFVIVIVMTIVGGSARARRGDASTSMPAAGSGRVLWVPLVAAVVAACVAVSGMQVGWATVITLTFATGTMLLSMVVVTGFTGQLSLCQYALGGFGAWMTARMIASNGLGLEPALLIGVASAALLGAVVAIPALRTRGVSLAVVTFGLALLLESIVFNSTLLGGIGGRFVLPTLFGIHIDPLHHPDRYLMVAIVLFALAAVAVANVRRGASGRRLLAVRSNERAAASLGVGVYGAKVYGFALAAAIAGLGGTLVAFRTPRIGFGALSVSSSISAVLYSLVGGIAWVSGSIIAATLSPGALNTKLLNDNFPQIGDVASWLALATSVAVVVMLRFAPDGAAASISRAARRAVPRTGRRARGPDPDQHAISGPIEPRRSPPVQGLTVTDVTVDFGGIRALDHVSFEVRTGEVVGLIGPNGAGKTTILDVISGFTAPDHGSVRLDGRSLDRLGPERRARAGIIRSWQHVELFDGLSVRENLLVAADPQLRRRYVTDLVKPGRPRWSALLQEVVDELQLGALLDVRPSSLSHGESRLVGIARAIVAEPAVLLLDEPAAGLDPRERGELAGIIRRLVVRLGIPVLAIEHDVALLLSVCDRIIVMEDGRVIASGTPEEVTRDAAVIRAYLGDVATLAD